MTCSSSTSAPSSPALVVSSSSNYNDPMTTTSLSIAILYISYRIAIANYSPITDCDETYNYWEPLHFLQFNSGMQTWEYAKPYELRTYGFLMPYLFASKVIVATNFFLLGDKRMLFYLLRSMIGAITATSELYFIVGIRHVFGSSIALVTLICLGISPGMFHASSALLPSTTVMQYAMISVGHTLQNYNNNNNNYEQVAILFGLMATLCTGWPFAAALFIPLGLRAIYLASSFSTTTTTTTGIVSCLLVISRTALHAVIIQSIITCIDYYYYQSFTLPTWNILKYNAMQGDDTLYGIEPFSFYMKNVLLNFNFIAIFASLTLPIIAYRLFLWCTIIGTNQHHHHHKQQQHFLKAMMYTLSPLILWLLLVCPRPHKEERFLFPIYPFIALACAFTLQQFTTIVFDSNNFVINKKEQTRNMWWHIVFYGCFFFPVGLLSISRCLALHTYYTAPLKLYSVLYDTITTQQQQQLSNNKVVVCLGGEWYRFPGSYMLPHGTSLEYLPSSFKGQLPQPFVPTLGSAVTDKQKHQQQPFNSINREEPSRYIKNILSCDYVIEYLSKKDDDDNIDDNNNNKIDVVKQQLKTDSWKEIASFPFLDAEATTGTLGRTLYIPSWLLSNVVRNVHYAKYSLFRRLDDGDDESRL